MKPPLHIDGNSVLIDVSNEMAEKIVKGRNKQYVTFGGIFHYTPGENDGIHSAFGRFTDVFDYQVTTGRKKLHFEHDDTLLIRLDRSP